MSTSLGVTFLEEDYNGVSRVDDTVTMDLSLDYSMMRWMDISFYIQMNDKESTRANIAFDKNVIGVSFSMSM